jgi:hypothetical protein
MFAPSRGLSQLATPFIASWSQGIRLVPVLLDSFRVSLKIPLKFSAMLLRFRFDLLIGFYFRRTVVEDSGIEPLTSCLQGRRSPG